MKKIILSVSIFVLSNMYAQEAKFNRLAVDANIGINNVMKPRFSLGFTEKDGFGRLSDLSFNIGGRYSLSNTFSTGLYLGLNKIGNSKNSNTSTFITVIPKGIINLSNLLGFDNMFNNKFRLLAHAGAGLGFLTNSSIDGSDKMIMLSAGLTPQYKINDKLSLNLDFQAYATYFQSRTWDFNSIPSSISGVMAQATVGVSYYAFGANKDKVHADWYSNANELQTKLDELNNKITVAEARLVDTDKDGVVDFLDVEPNTPEGSFVNTKGQRIVDMDGDGIVDNEDYCPTVKGSAEFKGCPTAFASEAKPNNDGIEGEEVQGELKFKVAKVTKDITFDTKSTAVKNNFKLELDALAKALNENTKLVVALHGHCDNVGEDALNNSLSTERAQSVRDYLVSKGVNASRITTKGHGTSQPKVSNDTEKGRATNRRVEFVVKSK